MSLQLNASYIIINLKKIKYAKSDHGIRVRVRHFKKLCIISSYQNTINFICHLVQHGFCCVGTSFLLPQLALVCYLSPVGLSHCIVC